MANDNVWREEVSASAGGSSVAVLIPAWVSDITATAKPGAGGSATIQHTTDDPNSIVDWIDWDIGSVSVDTTEALLGIVTALRITAVAQDAVMQITGLRRRQ